MKTGIVRVELLHLDWGRAVDECGFNGVFIDPEFTQADLPAGGLNEAGSEIEAELFMLDTETASEVLLTLTTRGGIKEFAHPLKVLAIGYNQATRDEFLEGLIFTIWASPRTGVLWFLALSTDHAKKRYLDVHSHRSNAVWYAGDRGVYS